MHPRAEKVSESDQTKADLCSTSSTAVFFSKAPNLQDLLHQATWELQLFRELSMEPHDSAVQCSHHASSCKSQRAATCPVEVPFMPRPQRSLPVKVSCLLALSSKNAAIVSRLSTSSHHELLFFEVQQQAGGGNPPGGLNMSLG